ncbi:MAG: CotH kinase family protein [Moraxellaceae bacterium]
MRGIILPFLLMLASFSIFEDAYSQLVHPQNNQAFLQNEVATVRVTLPSDSLAQLLNPANSSSDYEYTARFIYESSNGIDTVENVGFRIRGNTSRNAAKKSFKVSFNTYSPGRKWKNLDKLNLNGEHNDVSILRTQLSNMVLRNAGVPSSRTSYVKLYINNEYKGLYINVEHIDEEFLQRRFINDDSGNLYKCFYGSNLTYLGTNKNNYKNTYELQTNKAVDDYTGLIHFVDVLNNTSSANFACAINEVFDVDMYLKTLACEVLMGHWDGYSYNQNNFYLYQRPSDGKFVFIEYDMDNTFGVDWFSINWANRNIYTWSTGNRPLYTKIMAVPYYKERFTFYVDSFVNSFYNYNTLIPQIEQIQTLITPAALADNYKGLDYGFSNNDFQDAIYQAYGSHISSSIADFVDNRSISAGNQTTYTNPIIPCSLGIEENKLFGTPTKAYNLLGQPISVTTKGQLIILEDQFGHRKKTIQLD